MPRQILVGLLSAYFGLAGAARLMGEEQAAANEETASSAPVIQLAVLLDTSNSMDGLINQARTQLWKIVNELATAKRNGQQPDLRVALYEYGNNGLPKDQGFVRKVADFTDDLDKISEELFALQTNGGQEYCGQVIADATKNLAWTASDKDLKLIFIAGNEPFTQGASDYKAACAAAIERGITVNTIFCGPESQGIATGWQDGAKRADGSFLSIDQDREVATIKTPFDDKLARLSGAINTTYVVLGREADRNAFGRRQLRADAAAAGAAPAAAAERAEFKANLQYAAAAGDLVAGVKRGTIRLEDVADEELPEELRKLSLEKRKEYLAQKQAEREKLQAEIKKLSAERARYIAAEQQTRAEAGRASTFDAALLDAVRHQAAKRQFEFEKE